MTQLREIWTLRIRHDYFLDGTGRWGEVKLSPKTLGLLKRRGALWRRKGLGEWSLVCFEDDAFEETDELEITFHCTDANMIYHTQWDWKGDGSCRLIEVDARTDARIEMKTLPGSKVPALQGEYFRLGVSLRGIGYDRKAVAEVSFSAKELFWEYWLIPRDGNVARQLELELEGGKTAFIRCEEDANPLNVPLIKFRSAVPLKMAERGNERSVLYEMLPVGIRKPLARNLPLPECHKIPSERDDTAVSLLYF